MSAEIPQRRKILGLVCVVCTAVVLALYLAGLNTPWAHVDFGVRDMIVRYGRKSPANPQLVYLAIDHDATTLQNVWDDEIDASPALKQMKASGWPWTRDVYPHIIERLVGAGARVVAFDVLFPTPREGDEALRAAIDRHRERVVIGSNILDADRLSGSPRTHALPSPSVISPAAAEDCVGFVNVKPDFDGVVRRAIYQSSVLEFYGRDASARAPPIDSLPARALAKAGHGAAVPADRDWHLLRFAESSFAPRSVHEIFLPGFWERPPYNRGAFFRDKIVLVGPEGNWSKDYVRTPFGQMAGPELHLNAMNAALNGDFITETPPWAVAGLILLGGASAFLLGASVPRPVLRLTLFVGLTALGYAGAQALYNYAGVLTPVLHPLVALDASGFVWLVWEQVLERLERARTRRMFERFVSKNVVGEILDNRTSYLQDLGGVRKSVAIMMTDLRGFTTLTEAADSSQLVAQLNEYFTEMVRCVFAANGTLDKFIGDAILAVWGNVRSEGGARDAELAVTTALRMLRSLRQLNEEWAARGWHQLQMGIGINYGEVIFGAIGSEEKAEPTVIGDAVNLASRLEGLTKKYGQELLLGERLAELVRDRFHLQLVDFVRVAGKLRPINVYTVLGPCDEELPPGLARYLREYNEALMHYRDGRFREAEEMFRGCLKIRDGDKLAALYATRCAELAREQPAEWDGVFVMESK